MKLAIRSLFVLSLLLFNFNAITQNPLSLNDGLITESSGKHLAFAKLKTLDSLIDAKQLTNITSILIAKNGKLIYEKYYNGFSATSLHDTRSATKTITSMLIGIAIDKKFIPSTQTPALSFFSSKKPYQNPDSRKENITIEDLLTMSSLLECDDDNQFSIGNEERMYLTEDYIQFGLNLPIKGFPPFSSKPQDSPYGRAFSYCTAGTVLLGGIIEESSKMKVTAFADNYLFRPLKIESIEWQITPSGLPMTGGGLKLKSRDYIKLGILYASNGRWQGNQIISEGWVKQSTTPKSNARENVDYGYLWWLQSFGEGRGQQAFYMAGNGGSKIAIFPELELVVVITSNWYGTGKAHAQSESILTNYVLPSLR